MKTQIFSFLIAVSVITFTACNNNSEKSQKDSTDTSGSSSTATDNANVPEEKPSFSNVDAKTAASINEIVAGYLNVKNGLANDNSTEAANAAKSVMTALGKIDHAALPQDQMKLYMDVADDLKEMAEHISESDGKIDHQREHFVMMSQDVYDLVKGFGTNQPLYIDHCPMANDNKGADWMSEKKEISNPYMGKKMPTCGTVQKVIK